MKGLDVGVRGTGSGLGSSPCLRISTSLALANHAGALMNIHPKDRIVVLLLRGAWAIGCTYTFAVNLQGWGY